MIITSALQMEISIATYFDPRRNVIVPNVWWGMGLNHECDLMVLTKSGYAYEVEIKISKSDIKADIKKRSGHYSNKIRKLYFSIPERLRPYIDLIPDRAGILMVIEAGKYPGQVEKIREAKNLPEARKLTTEEQFNLAKLGSMRIWTIKQSIVDLYQRREDEQNPDKWRFDYLG